MEAFLYLLLPLLLLPLSLYLVSFRLKKSSDDLKKLPPGSMGWPMLGENIAFAQSGPLKFVKDRMQKYSPEVFKTSLMGEKMAVFCGVAGNKFLFTNEKKLVTSWWPKSIKKALMFHDLNESQSTDEFALKRTHNFHNDILKPEALKQYIPIMDRLAREHLDSEWKPNSVVKALSLSKKYTFEVACILFLSVVDLVHIKKLSDPFTRVINGMFSVPIELPGTAYNGAIKGGKLFREELKRIIKQRKMELMENHEEEGRDLLSKMLLATDEKGRCLSKMEISRNITDLLMASYDTTSTVVTMVMNYLAELPHIYDEVLKEQMAIAESKGPDELLTWDDIEKMKYSWNVVRESLRLTPPAQGAFREAITEFTYAGFTIPKGWKTFWMVNTTHMNPDYFPEPEKFDPSRFEGSGPPPYTYVPFGGGPRMCPGKEYARIQVLVFMYNVVTRFKLEKAVPNEKINVFYASPKPVHGLPLRLHPHEK